jgi:heme/copper-type cytochrome/quinol oxidase subunit 2
MIIDFYCQWMATMTVLIVPLLIQILVISLLCYIMIKKKYKKNPHKTD